MTARSTKIIYRASTIIFTVITLMYAANSLFNHELFSKRFAAMGHPAYLIYPLTIAKLLGLIAVWSNRSTTLKEWAYAGFFFVFVLAMLAELHASNGEYISSLIALIALVSSYLFWKRSFGMQSLKPE
jgi:hypothetical protein